MVPAKDADTHSISGWAPAAQVEMNMLPYPHMQLPKRKPGKYAHALQDPLMTRHMVEKLERDLLRLKKKQPEAAKEVSRLAEMGDFSENVEYQLAKGRLRGINNAILKLEHQLRHAEIIEAPAAKSNTVQVGHTVTVHDETGKQRSYTILGSTETNPQKGIISHTSPLGAALLGHCLGDTVRVYLPAKTLHLTIVALS